MPDEEPAPEESNEPVAQSGEKILESETTTAYSYIYASGKLLQEKVTANGATETHNFFYDNTGKPYAMQVNGTTYYYVTNLQGDVMGLVDTSGNSVASYTYDPYGKVLTATGALAEKNPLRYRGYYYDSESSLYYLQSRYYDPTTRRFVNADSYAGTGQGLIGYNMVAYCGNSPINSKDDTGEFWVTALFVAAAVCAVTFSGCSSTSKPSSDVGAAKPYVETPGSSDPNSPNCYAYAIGSPVNEQPGGTSGRIPRSWNDVDDVGASVVADLQAKGYTVRTISGPDAKVYENEFKIALRVGTKPFAIDQSTGAQYYDYHFMRQTSTGQWAEKHGYGGTSILWDAGMTPETIPWTLGGVNYYDSKIIYYAIGE